MLQRPLVSVVIPCYNHSQYLTDCLKSVLAQTLENWEAIVVDDASTEGDIAAIVESFQDRRIRFAHHIKNRGLGAARNTGFMLAQAELVLPLDADDMLAPMYLQKVVQPLQEGADADCAFPDFQLFGACSDIWHYQVRDAAAMTRGQWIPGAGTLMRRSLWERVGGYCEALEILGNEDWDFWLAAVTIGVQAVHIPEALYLYRRHEASMAARLKYEDFRHREFMYRRHRALFDRYGTGSDFRADGYMNSAFAAKHRGERLRAACLAAQAWWLSPKRMDILKVMVETVMPAFLLPVARKGWGLLRRLRRSRNTLIETPYELLYRSGIGRKVLWNRWAKDIDQRHGNLSHDYSVLTAIFTSLAPNRVLDIGCGSGRLFPLYQTMGIKEVVGQDIVQSALDLARTHHNYQSIQLLNIPITDLDFPASYFDLVICDRVLPHIPPDGIELTIKTLCRLGKFVYVNEGSVGDKVAPSYFLFQHDYVHLFDKYGFLVKDEGFVTSENNTQQKWFLFGGSLEVNRA